MNMKLIWVLCIGFFSFAGNCSDREKSESKMKDDAGSVSGAEMDANSDAYKDDGSEVTDSADVVDMDSGSVDPGMGDMGEGELPPDEGMPEEAPPADTDDWTPPAYGDEEGGTEGDYKEDE